MATYLEQTGCLSPANLPALVNAAVSECQVIDLHTHLFPPSHAELLLWGIDDLLTYHYLVSEFFMVAPGTLTHAEFFAQTKAQQADLVWEYLFVKRTPLSEAQIGVLTTLRKLGLGELLQQKKLPPIRAWFQQQDPALHAENVFVTSKVKYCVMTNIPFEPKETCKWVTSPDAPIVNDAFLPKDVLVQTYDKQRFRTALRIDPILKGDWGTIQSCLKARGLPLTLAGARSFLIAWAKVYDAEYLMASTPERFGYRDTDTGPASEGWFTATELIDQVMIPVARALNLPLAMKFGACRGMQPNLNPCGGGDGVTVADTSPLKQMCQLYPDVKFLATFLSRVNQHGKMEQCCSGRCLAVVCINRLRTTYIFQGHSLISTLLQNLRI